jgi:hypothetical protein
VWTLLYTSTVAPTYPLLLDTAIYTTGAQLQNVQFGAGSCSVSSTATPTLTPTGGAPVATPTATRTATVTATASGGSSAPCGPVTWAHAVNVTATANSIQKTAGGDAWNAGASSSTQLSAGNGGAQIRVDSTVGYRLFGLSNGDPDQNYTTIKYALYPANAGALYVFEAGVNRGQFGTYTTGDLLKVELVSGVVRYYRQAVGSGVWTLLYTSTVAPTYPLLLDTAIYTAGAQLQNVQFGAGTCP